MRRSARCADARRGEARHSTEERIEMADENDPKRRMFGDYRLKPNSGVNPPYSPAYPVEWGCTLRTVEIMTRVASSKVASLLADTPFEIASDRVAFRFMLSPGHSMAVHAGQMFD